MGFFRRETYVERQRVIIVGAGEVGYNIARRLVAENRDVVVIDRNPESLRRITDSIDAQTIVGSGATPSVLREAGVEEAEILLAVTDSDEINIISCLFASQISPATKKVARIRNLEYSMHQEDFLQKILGIQTLINPEVEVVQTIEHMLTVPGAVEYNEFAGGQVKMVGIKVEKGPLVGEPLYKFREIAKDEGIIVAAIVRAEELLIPSGRNDIQTNDLVYFVCKEESLPRVREITQSYIRPVHDVCIVGCGNIGLQLARKLEAKGMYLKIVEISETRCEVLADALNNALILHGDGTDIDLMRQENVGTMDIVVALTGNEEVNILSCLLAKSLGTARAVIRVNNMSYQSLVRNIGIEHSVSPRISAVNSILRHIRKGKVLSSVAIMDDEAEVMEVVAQEDSAVVGLPLRELGLPNGVLMLAVVRNHEVAIPTGDTVIKPDDRVILFTTRRSLNRVENFLTVSKRA